MNNRQEGQVRPATAEEENLGGSSGKTQGSSQQFSRGTLKRRWTAIKLPRIIQKESLTDKKDASRARWSDLPCISLKRPNPSTPAP